MNVEHSEHKTTRARRGESEDGGQWKKKIGKGPKSDIYRLAR